MLDMTKLLRILPLLIVPVVAVTLSAQKPAPTAAPVAKSAAQAPLTLAQAPPPGRGEGAMRRRPTQGYTRLKLFYLVLD